MKQVSLTLEQIERLAQEIKNHRDYGCGEPRVLVSIDEHPNGRPFVQFEQPCEYSECNSTYYRYES
jgi:hypothetical protein